jgi:hypothetical protein
VAVPIFEKDFVPPAAPLYGTDAHPPNIVTQWCFAPQGDLAVGDVMLTQKIALETMEWKALASANSRVLRP